MTPRPISVSPDTPVGQAALDLARRRLNALPVVDEDGRVIAPAVDVAVRQGIRATGPHPADTVFIAAASGGKIAGGTAKGGAPPIGTCSALKRSGSYSSAISCSVSEANPVTARRVRRSKVRAKFSSAVTVDRRDPVSGASITITASAFIAENTIPKAPNWVARLI